MSKLLIIGAGPGGYELALEASRKGLNVTLFEECKLGGTCLNQGCIPTKVYHNIAKQLKSAKKLDKYGLSISGTLDYKAVFDRKNSVVKQLSDGIQFMLNKQNVTIVNGHATLLDKHTVLCNGEKYAGDYIVIATGSSAQQLPIDNVKISDDILAIDDLPQSMAIIGAGVIGIELATIFNQFGVNVEMFELGNRILPNVDSEVSKRLENYLKSAGIVINLKSNVVKYHDNILTYINTSENQKHFDICLQTVGRIANVENLGLERVGINFSKKGIDVNQNFQTNIDNIYAIGDVTGKNMLAHVATFQGYAALNHITGVSNTIDFMVVPSCIFSLPQVACCGLSEDSAKLQQLNYKKVTSFYRANGKANAIEETDGFVKILISEDYIIGSTIIGEDADILIHELSTLMNNKVKVSEACNFIHAHPTLNEIILSALRMYK